MSPTVNLDSEKMTEAEVSLRLAIYFAEHADITGHINVAIDGARVQGWPECNLPIVRIGLENRESGSGQAICLTLCHIRLKAYLILGL